MIEQFKDMEMRRSGVIYNSTLEQIKKLYEVDPERAGELAISAIELVLCGDISSDDVMVALMLEPTRKINENVQEKYDTKVENAKQKKMVEQKLDKIAELANAGLKQREIGERLGLSQQIVSYRMSVIRQDYPHLLQTTYKNTKENTNNLQKTYKNTNDTKDTNFVQICTDDSFVEEEIVLQPGEDWRKKFSF